MTQAVWTGPNSGPMYPSGAQCRSPVVQTPVTSGRPAQVQILFQTLMLYILSAAKHFCGNNSTLFQCFFFLVSTTCECKIPRDCSRDGKQMYCLKLVRTQSTRSMNLCFMAAMKCSKMEFELLHEGPCAGS